MSARVKEPHHILAHRSSACLAAGQSAPNEATQETQTLDGLLRIC